MKVVIDTNVLISAFVSPGKIPSRIIRAWRLQEIALLFSLDILAEYERVLHYPQVRRYSKMTDQDIAEIISSIQMYAVVVHVSDLIPAVSSDPDDDKFLACAVAGNADAIISGDKHLLTLGSYSGIPILTPTDFLSALEDDHSSHR